LKDYNFRLNTFIILFLKAMKEKERISDVSWKKWGPYVSNREWGLVREDYSENGDAWNYTNHDTAEAKHTDGERRNLRDL
jgi:hypothetical protein